MIRSTLTTQCTLLLAALAALAAAQMLNGGPLAAQQVVELPAEDRILDTEFEEVYRVGSMDGDEWEVFGRVSAVGFGESGNLYVMDDQGRLCDQGGYPGRGSDTCADPAVSG